VTREDEQVTKMAEELARLINKNIQEITACIAKNIDYEKNHTILAAFSGLYTVSQYFEMKLSKAYSIPAAAIEKSKQKAELYAIEVLADEHGEFMIDEGEA